MTLRDAGRCRGLGSVLVLAACGEPAGVSDEAVGETVGTTGTSDASSEHASSESDVDDETGTETATEAESETGPLDLLEQLQAIEGMSAEELPATDDGARVFDLHYLQPNDHEHPDGPWFEQHVHLQHREATAPMVLFTTGYGIVDDPTYASEPTVLLHANQLDVEHRFFGTSQPEPRDFGLLTIEQAAADHHRLVEALRPIYGGRWLSTGISKGGMASIYHRRFHPDDVDATLAYVAPHSFGLADPRYADNLELIGEPACAEALRELQLEALARRSQLLPMLMQTAVLEGYTYERYGSHARVFEAGVAKFRWAFWQGSGKPHCPFVPGAEATDSQIFWYINQHLGWGSYDDERLARVESYYYQAAHQLGAPAITEPHLVGLLEFPLEVGWDARLPAGTAPAHDPAAMLDISAWLAGEGERLMFVYGAWDPWSGGAFDPSGALDTHLYWVAEADHDAALLSGLPTPAYDEAMAILDAWMGLERGLAGVRALRAEVRPHPSLAHPL